MDRKKPPIRIEGINVALERLELSQTEPESGVLPLHHKALLFFILWKDSNSLESNNGGTRIRCATITPQGSVFF